MPTIRKVRAGILGVFSFLFDHWLFLVVSI
jgi:hypothetical protein